MVRKQNCRTLWILCEFSTQCTHLTLINTPTCITKLGGINTDEAHFADASRPVLLRRHKTLAEVIRNRGLALADSASPETIDIG